MSSTNVVPPEASRVSVRKSGDSISGIREDESRESFGEESLEKKDSSESVPVVEHDPSVIVYDEYKEDEDDEAKKTRIHRQKSTQEPHRVLSLVEKWQLQQKSRISMAAAAAKARQTEGKTTKTPRKAVKTLKDAEEGEGKSIKEQMIKDMQDEIRLEQFNKQRRGELAAIDMENRERHLLISQRLFDRYWDEYMLGERVREEEENWSRFMNTDGLPNPTSLADLNAFIMIWKMDNEDASMDTVARKCQMIVALLLKIERIIRFSTTVTKEYIVEYKSIAEELRTNLQRWIDLACYRLLRNIEENMVREDMKTTRYVLASTDAICCVWAPIPLPIGLERASDKERPIQVKFDEMQLTIKMPADVRCYRMAIRGLWLSYDHYSIATHSFDLPTLSDELCHPWDSSADLLSYMRRELQEKLKIWAEQAEERNLRVEEKKGILERMVNPMSGGSRFDRKGKRGKKRPQSGDRRKQTEFDMILAAAIPPEGQLLPYLPTPTEILRKREEDNWSETKKLFFIRCQQDEVNLRKYRIIGGVIHLDLVYQPPQPKDLGHDTWLTTLELPKEPKFVTFRRTYEAPVPAPESERTPEVIEAEMKALETAMEKLPLITLTLSESIFWFEPPLVAHWVPDKQIWSTKDIHDVKYNEEKQTIAFRSGRLGIHALALSKFSNLPFQSWELRPESGKNGREFGGVILNITGAAVQVEFLVRDDRICLNSLVGGSSIPLKHIMGKFTDMETIVKQMQEVGCNFFPHRDAPSYFKGLTPKHPIVERHLRFCMALLSTSYIFTSSRWNATRSFRELVVQFKEVHGCVANRERTNITLLVTPSRTKRVQCTEVSPEFSDLPFDDVEDSKEYYDLYHLAVNTAGIKTRLLFEQISYKVMTTVSRLLKRTSVLNMSS